MQHELLKEVAKIIAQKAQKFPLEQTPFVDFNVRAYMRNDKFVIEGGNISIGYAEFSDDMDVAKTETIIIGTCQITQLKGCNGVAVVSNLKIDEEHRNKGLATYLIDLVNLVCNTISYNYIICTTKEDNMAMRSVLAKNEYKELFEFKNAKTDNEVVFLALNLTKYNNFIFDNNTKRSVFVSINSNELQ